MRLIDADAIKIPSTSVDMFENCRNCNLLDEYQVREIIDATPTIEPKRGEWKYIYKGKWIFRRCSCCEWTQTYDDTKYMGYRYNFCPNCGADMRKESER